MAAYRRSANYDLREDKHTCKNPPANCSIRSLCNAYCRVSYLIRFSLQHVRRVAVRLTPAAAALRQIQRPAALQIFLIRAGYPLLHTREFIFIIRDVLTVPFGIIKQIVLIHGNQKVNGEGVFSSNRANHPTRTRVSGIRPPCQIMKRGGKRNADVVPFLKIPDKQAVFHDKFRP